MLLSSFFLPPSPSLPGSGSGNESSLIVYYSADQVVHSIRSRNESIFVSDLDYKAKCIDLTGFSFQIMP